MDYYSGISRGYDELYGEEQKKKFEILKRNLKLEGLVLDVGAGTGLINGDFIRIEPSFAMIEKAKGMRACGVAENLPFKSNVFDCVISLTALHHTDIKKSVKEIKRVLKKKGRIGISLLKKSKNFEKEAEEIKNNFKVKEIDEGKDLLLFTQKESLKERIYK